MSKNMTRKGLAIGVGATLVATTFGFAPANANGLADKSFVSLTPRSGTEYAVLIDQYFDLSSNVVSSLAGTSGKDLKFLISDPQSKVFVDQSQITTTPFVYDEALANGAGEIDSAAINSNTLTVTVDGTTFASGNLFLYNFSDATAAAALNGTLVARASDTTGTRAQTATNVTYTVTAGRAANTTGLNSRETILANGAIDADLFESATITTSIAGKTITNGRASDGTFVVNTETNANTADRLLRLVTNSTSTYSVTITAWVDDNDNGLIDATEYTSPQRTVQFVKPGDVTAVTTLSPVVGDETMKASITTTPTLNGQQVLLQDKNFLNAKFTRSSTATAIYAEADKGTSPYNNATAVWNDTSKTWTVEVSLDADAADESDKPAGGEVADAWGAGLVGPTDRTTGNNDLASISVATSGIATITTAADHNLKSGDKVTVTVDAAETDAVEVAAETAAVVTVTGARSFTYAMTETTKPAAAATDSSIVAASGYTVETYSATSQGLIDRVGAETYSAVAVIQTAADETAIASWTAISAVAETGVTSAATADVEASTTASASVQGKTFNATGTNTVKVLTGTKSVAVTFTALDADGDALGAGRPVVVALSASGTADTFRVNGKTADTVLTDANGQATVTITAVNGYAGAVLQVTGTIENADAADVDLTWENQSFGLVDLATTAASVNTSETRTMQALGTYAMNLAVLDQWYTAPAANLYRLKVTGEGAPAQYVNLTAGKATVTVTDTGVFGDQVITVVTLEKLSGTTVTSSTDYTVTADVVKTFNVVLGADGSTLYGTAADLSDKVAAKALLELDKRIQAGATPAYANDVVINGRVMNKATSAGKQGALVTVSGPSNILFSVGEKAARGSLTFLSGSGGDFVITAYSTTAQTDSVITVTSNGASATTKVSFTGTGVGEGTSLVITAPANVKPASTFQVKAKLSDAYGNPVDTAAGRVKVTYSGPGIVFGTLPDQTDANGELMFSVLLGSNDTGNVVVTVSYDQNGDADYVDAKDLNTTKTTVVGSGAAAGTGKVNVASFNGRLVVYAANLNGKRISWKVNGRWGSAVADSNFDSFNRPTSRAGVTVNVEVFVDGVSTLTKSVVTR